ncbi:hypothetical protein DV736_g5385, partial [Chaetothyriales sp. CBS 134916]
MPSTTFSLSHTTPALPQWQVIIFLAHLSHTEVFPNVNRAALAKAKAAAIARGIDLSGEQIDGLVRRFLNLSRSEKVALRSMDVRMIGPRQVRDTAGLASSNYTWTRNAAGEGIITITIMPNQLTAPAPIRPRTCLEADIDNFFKQWKIYHPADFPASGLVQPQQPESSPLIVGDFTAFLGGVGESTTTSTVTTAVDLPQPSSASPWPVASAPQQQQTDPFPKTANVPFQPALPSPPVVAPLPTYDFGDALIDDGLFIMDVETDAIINNPYYTFEDNMAFLDASAALAPDNDGDGVTPTQLTGDGTTDDPTVESDTVVVGGEWFKKSDTNPSQQHVVVAVVTP